MKRMSLFFAAIFLSIALFSQNGNLKTQAFYFRFGLSIPTWKYFGATGKSDWSDMNMKRYGGVFEMGSIFMLNSIKIAKGLRIGINVDYLSVNAHVFTFDEMGNSATNLNVFVGSKIGPSISYSPVKPLVFDVFGKINPVWYGGSATTFSGNTDANEAFTGNLGIKYSIGFNLRFSVLMMGFEFNPGSMKLKSTDTHEFLGNSMSANDKGDKTKMPGYNVTIGLSF